VFFAQSANADNVDGAWSSVADWPLIAIHAALTPDGRILTYGTDGSGKQTAYFIYDIWDPAAGLAGGHITLQNMTLTDIFCSSQIILPQSGEILISGGDNWTGTRTTNTGNNNSNLFDYGDNTLARSVNMNRARWYSSSTALVNGEIYIQGGSGGADRPEVRDTEGGFRLLTGAPTGGYATLFPRNFLAPDGRVFGYDTSGKMYFVTTGGSGSIASAGQFSSSNAGWTSGAAMFRPGKILQMGGNSNGAVVIDINGPQPQVTSTQSMSSQRRWVSATVLADGQVLATGGSRVENQLTDVNNSAEIWNPDTGLWHVGSSGARARLYHSSALLLPDATVLVAGGGAPGPLVNTNAEIYSPPYLFDDEGNLAARPQILNAPDVADVGDNLTLEVDSRISRLTLVKSGSVTHSVNMDQRFLELPFSASGNMLQVSLPARASDTPPGYYLMFAFNELGVPSVASMLRINIDDTPNVEVDYTPTIGGGGGGPFQLACPLDEIVVGVYGKYGTYVNQVGPQCVKIDQLGRWIGNPTNGPVTGSTSSGSAFSKTCPRDFAVSGFRGRSGAYVNQIDIQCRALTPTGGLSGAEEYLGATGGSGGSSQGPLSCGTNNPVFALYGRSGGWLDNFGVQCRQAQVTPISINSSPVLVNPGTQSGIVGVPIDLQLSASDGDSDALSFSATGLPDGLLVAENTGRITGVPSTASTYNVVVTVSDGTETDTASFEWNIDAVIPLSVDPMPAQDAVQAGVPKTFTASARNGLDVVYKWDFGDGTETDYASSNSVSHSFVDPGIYFVTLTVDDAISDPITQTFVQRVHLELTAEKPSNSSNIAFEERIVGNSRIWVVNQDNDSVTAFDATTGSNLAEIAVGEAPRAIALAPDGRVWVTNKSSSTISIINSTSFAVEQVITLPGGSAPYGLLFSPLANAAYVALEAAGQLLKLDGTTGASLAIAPTRPNPRHLSIDAAGSSVYVSRFITPRQPGEETETVQSTLAGELQGGEIAVFDATSMLPQPTLIIQHSDRADAENQGRGVPNYLGAMTISPDGTHARVPSKQDNIMRGTLRDGANINFQNTVRAISSRIDLDPDAENYAARIDHDNASVASAVAYDPLGIYLFVSLETSREIAVVDVHGGFEMFRIDAGRAPQGIAVSSDGLRLFVNNFMDRSVGVYDLTELQHKGQWSVPLVSNLQSVGSEALPPEVFAGKQLFYDARDTRLARDRYMSCASCHNDGGYDGRVWDLTGMGEGLRSTIDLRGSGANPGRLHWSQNFDEVQDFEGQIRDLAGGTGLMADIDFDTGTRSDSLGDPKAGVSADLDDLAAYVESLDQYANSPHRNDDGTLTADAVLGKEIFRRENCAACHSGEEFTDSATDTLHDIGTLTAFSGFRLGGALPGIDTPTLRGVWGSAPYLHDGSALTLADAVTEHNSVSLDAIELSLLVAYVEQIDGREPSAPEPETASDLIVDNLDVNTSQTGTWASSIGADPYQGSSFYTADGGVFSWHPELSASGEYEVYAWWTYWSGRSTSAPYRIDHDGGTDTVTVNQRDAALGGQWVLLGTYSFTAGVNGDVSVSGENGNTSADAVRFVPAVATPPDDTPPSTPTGVTATAVSGTQIDLQWTASTDDSPNVTYYVYRDGDYDNPIGSVLNEVSYSVLNLALNTTYSFEVRAEDAAGNQSALSNPPAFATTLNEAPVLSEAIVDNLDVNTSQTGIWSSSIGVDPYQGNSVYSSGGGVFSWHPELSASGEYEVYAWWTYWSGRSTSVPYRIDHDGGTDTVTVNQQDPVLGGQWVLLGTYNFTAGVNGDVSVSGENGNTSADAVRFVPAVATPPDDTPPSTPTGVTATAVSGTQIDLQWTASTDDSPNVTYYVYRDGDYDNPIGSVLNEVSYSVLNLALNTTYSFEVRAEDAAGNQSALSNPPAFATTLNEAPVLSEAIVDNLDVNTSQTGIWSSSIGVDPYQGNSVYSSGGGVFSWHPELSASGEYEVYAWWTYWSGRSTSVPYRIDHDGGTDTVTVNQQDPVLGGQWVLLGTYNFTAGVNGDVSVSGENGNTSADAVRFVPAE
jgi:YVTN family beta-propeller protein